MIHLYSIHFRVVTLVTSVIAALAFNRRALGGRLQFASQAEFAEGGAPPKRTIYRYKNIFICPVSW
jgi:SSS family solute:Na+ symporter